jgi:hypothetical protein
VDALYTSVGRLVREEPAESPTSLAEQLPD